MNKPLPIHYFLEIRIGSLREPHVEHIETSMPFQAFEVGDKFVEAGFNTEAWYDLPSEGEAFYITGKEHIVTNVKDMVCHKVVLCIKAAPLMNLSGTLR